MPSSGITGAFIQFGDLQALSKIHGDHGLIFSLYLDLRPGGSIDRFTALLYQLEQQKRLEHATAAFREQWAVEADQIRRWLETESLPQGSSLALFSSLAAGLWQVFRLPVPVCDLLVAGDRPHLKPAEIVLEEIKTGKEQHVEAQRVDELLTKARESEGAVLGPEHTFLAVRSRKVRLLIVEEDFCMPGGECPNCGFLDASDSSVCLLCGVALHPEPNIIEVAMKRVLDGGGEIEVLRSRDLRRALEQHGHIGALLNLTGKLPVKEIANQQVIEQDGKIDGDALYDETIEESFPASDPPG